MQSVRPLLSFSSSAMRAYLATLAAAPGSLKGGDDVDPEEAAMELLTSQLGARRVDGR